MLAPDPQGRKLAAVFTTPDAADAFIREVGSSLAAPPVLRVYDGSTLFAYLARLPIDGIVFNCKGPGLPRVVATPFAQRVLTS